MSLERTAAVEQLNGYLYVFWNDREARGEDGFALSVEEIGAIQKTVDVHLSLFNQGVGVADVKGYFADFSRHEVTKSLLAYGRAQRARYEAGLTGTTQYTSANAARSFVDWYDATKARVDGMQLPDGISRRIVDIIHGRSAPATTGAAMLVEPRK